VSRYNASLPTRNVGLNEKNSHLNVASIYYAFRFNCPTFYSNLALVRVGFYLKHLKFCVVMGEFQLLCALPSLWITLHFP